MIFHLAIPSSDLERDAVFYQAIGAVLGRKYSTHVVLNFFDHQLVLHKVKVGQTDQEPSMYPRHFGVIAESYEKFTHLVSCFKGGVPPKFIFQDVIWRSRERPEEHCTFFLRDPSNNLLEFKWYKDQRFLF